MFCKSIALMSLVLCTASVFALPKPSEVKDAFASGNYAKAESMLQEVIHAKPSATAYWQLGQVFSAEGKHNQAINQYQQAQNLDPTLKFASSKQAFMKAMSSEMAIVAPPPLVTANNPILNAQVSVLTPVPQIPVYQSNGTNFSTVLLVLLSIGAIMIGIMFFFKRKTIKDKKDISAADSRVKTNELLELAKKLEDAILITKTSSSNDTDKANILSRINGLQQSIRKSLADIKDGKVVTNGSLSNLEDMVNNACDQAQNGITVQSLAQSDSRVEPVRPVPVPNYPSSAASSSYVVPTQNTFHHYHNVPAPAPYNNDLLTGVLIGESLNRPAERIVYVEQQVSEPRQLDTNQDDSYITPESQRYSAPVLDTNNDSNDSYDSGTSNLDSSGSSDSDDSY